MDQNKILSEKITKFYKKYSDIIKITWVILWIALIVIIYKYDLTQICSTNWKYCSSFFGYKASLDITEDEYLMYTSLTWDNISLVYAMKLISFDLPYFIKKAISIFSLPILFFVVYWYYDKIYTKIKNKK